MEVFLIISLFAKLSMSLSWVQSEMEVFLIISLFSKLSMSLSWVHSEMEVFFIISLFSKLSVSELDPDRNGSVLHKQFVF